MSENHQMYWKSTILFVLLFSLLVVLGSVAFATEVDRMSLSLEGFPGKIIEQEITLEGTELEERTGFWYTHYKEIEGDDKKMDITAWITIEPENYAVKQGEVKTFTVRVKIPKDAEPGLYGATSEQMGQAGHSSERRTYLVFKDALAGGNVYSGLLIPISVNVLKSPNPLAPIINFVRQNIMTMVLSAIIIILLVIMFLKKKKQFGKVSKK